MDIGLRPVGRSLERCRAMSNLTCRTRYFQRENQVHCSLRSPRHRIRRNTGLLCVAHAGHGGHNHTGAGHDHSHSLSHEAGHTHEHPHDHDHGSNGSSSGCCSSVTGHSHGGQADNSNLIHRLFSTVFDTLGLTPLAAWLESSKPSSAAKILLFFIAAGATWWAPRAADIAAGEAARRIGIAATAGVYFFAGIPAAIDLVYDITALRIDTHVLMNLAVVGTLITGLPLEGALLLVLFQTSHAVEHLLTERAQGSLQALYDAVPDHADLITLDQDGAPNMGSTRRVLAADVAVGETMLIKPGGQVPLDGVIVYGRALVSAEHITGESLPNLRRSGDEVPAGALCHDGVLVVKASQKAADSTPARIARLARDAQAQRPQLKTWLDRFGEIYSRLVIVMTGATLVGMLAAGVPMGTSGAERGALYRSMTLLTVASPCALVMVPLAYVSAIAAAASRGVLLKGGRVLDALDRCRVIAVDKTGTLTTGKLGLVDFSLIGGGGEVEADTEVSSNNKDKNNNNKDSIESQKKDALAAAVALSLRSSHPVSDAVVQMGDAQGVDANAISVADFNLVPGGGVSGTIENNNSSSNISPTSNSKSTAMFGSLDYVASELSREERAAVEAQLSGRSARSILSVLLMRPNDSSTPQSVWVFLFEDTLQSVSKGAVEELQTGSWVHEDSLMPSASDSCDVVMLTGDNKISAQQVAKKLGITRISAGLSPEEKLEHVTALRSSGSGGGGVVMVGDGLNDAAALAAADVGVAIASPTTAAATLASDAVVMRGAAGIAAVPLLMRIARATRQVVKQNLILAAASILALSLPAVLGFIPLWVAVMLHEGSTLLVALNSLRLLRFSAGLQGKRGGGGGKAVRVELGSRNNDDGPALQSAESPALVQA